MSQNDEEEVTTSIRHLKEMLKCDPLEYWKANKMVYPRLASKYQSAPPGSDAPERLFSTARQILKPTEHEACKFGVQSV